MKRYENKLLNYLRVLVEANLTKAMCTGGDDRRVLLWNIEEALHGVNQPTAMRAQHSSNIFCLGYDSKNTKIFSAGNDDQVIVHDTNRLLNNSIQIDLIENRLC